MTTMENLPEVVPLEEWPAARMELLVKEKELTRARVPTPDPIPLALMASDAPDQAPVTVRG